MALFLIFIINIFMFEITNAWLLESFSTSRQRQLIQNEYKKVFKEVNTLLTEITKDINQRIFPIKYKLINIKYDATNLSILCAEKIVEDTDTFYEYLQIIYKCVNKEEIEDFKSDMLIRLIDKKMKLYSNGECRIRQEIYCDDREIDIIGFLNNIRDETFKELVRFRMEATECIETRLLEMNDKLQEIENNWQICLSEASI